MGQRPDHALNPVGDSPVFEKSPGSLSFSMSPETSAMQCTDSSTATRFARLLSMSLMALALGACASKSTKPPSNLTPEHYAKTTTVTPKPDQDAIHLNTEKGFEEPYEDNRHYRGTYLLAAIDRKTGKAAIGVDFMQMTDTPRNKVVVTYEAPEGLMRQTIYVKNGRRQCRENDCRFLESISIPLKESLVRHYANSIAPISPVTGPTRSGRNIPARFPMPRWPA